MLKARSNATATSSSGSRKTASRRAIHRLCVPVSVRLPKTTLRLRIWKGRSRRSASPPRAAAPALPTSPYSSPTTASTLRLPRSIRRKARVLPALPAAPAPPILPPMPRSRTSPPRCRAVRSSSSTLTAPPTMTARLWAIPIPTTLPNTSRTTSRRPTARTSACSRRRVLMRPWMERLLPAPTAPIITTSTAAKAAACIITAWTARPLPTT